MCILYARKFQITQTYGCQCQNKSVSQQKNEEQNLGVYIADAWTLGTRNKNKSFSHVSLKNKNNWGSYCHVP